MKITDSQKKCPYCHKQDDRYAKPIVGDFDDIGCGLMNVSGTWYMTCWDFLDATKFAGSTNPLRVCPMCRRPLNEEEE